MNSGNTVFYFLFGAVVWLLVCCASEEAPLQPRKNLTLTPQVGVAGMKVTIRGFSGNPSEVPTVLFGDKAAKVVTYSQDEMVVEAPSDGISASIKVISSKEQIAGPIFRYYDVVMGGVSGTSIVTSKNGQLTSLADVENGTLGMASFGDEVLYMTGSADSQPGYFTNGVFQATDTFAVSIVKVVGGDVYLVGNMFGDVVKGLHYMKNGEIIPLPLGSSYIYGTTSDIEVSDGNVYISGAQGAIDYLGNTYYVATVWKNAVAREVGDLDSYSQIVDMTVDGSVVYALGETRERSYGSTKKVVYWKDDQEIEVPAYLPRAIAVKGSDVYVAGAGRDGINYVARVWKNGVSGVATSDRYNSIYEGIFFVGNDVFVFGDSFFKVNDHVVTFPFNLRAIAVR